MSRILMFTSVISLWSYFMFYIACFSTYDVLLKRLCHSCNFILSPHYCFVHVDLVVTFFFFWISDLVVTYVAFVFIFIYKLSFVSIQSSINPFRCHIYQTLSQLVSLERQKEFLGLLNPQPPPWTSSAASWHHFWRSHWM